MELVSGGSGINVTTPFSFYSDIFFFSHFSLLYSKKIGNGLFNTFKDIQFSSSYESKCNKCRFCRFSNEVEFVRPDIYLQY